jgi:hypothetical protein
MVDFSSPVLTGRHPPSAATGMSKILFMWDHFHVIRAGSLPQPSWDVLGHVPCQLWRPTRRVTASRTKWLRLLPVMSTASAGVFMRQSAQTWP